MLRAILTLLLLSAGGVCAQHRMVNHVYDPTKTKTEVRVTTLFSELPTSGYMPVRIYLKNGTKLARTWSFSFKSFDEGWMDSGNEMRSSFSAYCDAGQVTSYEFLVPLVTAFQDSFDSSAGLSVVVTAPGFSQRDGHLSTTYQTSWSSISMSDDLFTVNASKLDAETKTYLGGPTPAGGHGHFHSGGTSNVRFGGSFDPRQLSEDWRAYAGLDVVMMTESAWKDAQPGARNALLRWNRLGGSLLIYAISDGTDLSTLGIAPEGRGVRKSSRSWGRVEILKGAADRSLDPAATVSQIAKTLPAAVGNGTLITLSNDFTGRWPLQIAFGSKTAHVLFFILVLIAFGILVGPVNLFVFAKAGQRHRLFVTTPIISISASLLLVVLILFQDGFGGRGRRVLLVEVRPDNGENAAYVSQEQIARTGVLLSTHFTTTETASVTPVLIDDSRWARVTKSNNGGKSRYTSDVLEQGLRLAGDWFQSRSEHGHYLQTIRPTRGRIELVSENPPVVTSTFEFTLSTLTYTAPDGSQWSTEDLRQGRQTTLSPASAAQFSSWFARVKALFSARNQKRLDLTAERANHFIAFSGEVSAIGTLESINWTQTDAVITGPVVRP